MSSEILMVITTVEGRYLYDLVAEFRQVVDAASATADPAVARMTPDIYPDDEEASAAFRDTMHEELLDRRQRDARIVQAALRPFSEDAATAETSHEVSIVVSEVDPWLRTLSAMRLIMADRLGIATQDDHDVDDLRFGVYDWIGYRLDVLVQLADDQDARRRQ